MENMDIMEEVKAYWDRRPCNIKHSKEPLGTLKYFKEVEQRRYYVEPHIVEFAQFYRWKDKNVLEIGSGIGIDAINFAREGARLTVVDISEKSLEICKKGFENFGFNAQFYCGNAEELSSFVPIETYDLIYSFGSIHHSPHPEAIFSEIKKFCGPHTEIRIMLYAKYSWKVLWIIMNYGKGRFWRARELVRNHSEAEVGCPLTHIYSFKEVYRLMSDFEIVSILKTHIFPYEIKKYIKYEYERVWYFRILPKTVFNWLKGKLGWHLLIVAKAKI